MPPNPHPHPHLTALPCSEHQLLVAVTHNSTVLEDACSGELQPSNHSHPADPYVAAVLNLSAPTDFVLGDGTRGHGFHNAPLHPGWDYTALLRLARRSAQVPVPGALVDGAGQRPPCPQPQLGPLVALGAVTWVMWDCSELSVLCPSTGGDIHLRLLQLLHG